MHKLFLLKQWYPGLPKIWKNKDYIVKYPHKHTDEEDFWEPLRFDVQSVRHSPQDLRSTTTIEDLSNLSPEHKAIKLNRLLNNKWSIYSVKRLSGGEVFTVGDEIKRGHRIQAFFLPGIVAIEGKINLTQIDNIEPVDPVAVISRDGEPLETGDTYYQVGWDSFRNSYFISPKTIKEGKDYRNETFIYASRGKAEEWVDKHKPKYSITRVIETLKDTCAIGVDNRYLFAVDLEEVKEKLEKPDRIKDD